MLPWVISMHVPLGGKPGTSCTNLGALFLYHLSLHGFSSLSSAQRLLFLVFYHESQDFKFSMLFHTSHDHLVHFEGKAVREGKGKINEDSLSHSL